MQRFIPSRQSIRPSTRPTIDGYLAAVPVALDGSRTAIAHKNKLRNAAIRMYGELAHYVEANCNDDMATFLLSGFQPAATTKGGPAAAGYAFNWRCCSGASERQGEAPDQTRSESGELRRAVRARSNRRNAYHMDGGDDHEYEIRDHRQPHARNHVHVPGPCSRTPGQDELE